MPLTIHPNQCPPRWTGSVASHVDQRPVSGDVEIGASIDARSNLGHHGDCATNHFKALEIECDRSQRASGEVHKVATRQIVRVAATVDKDLLGSCPEID